MSTAGKICLVLTLLLLLVALLPISGPYAGWAPELLVIHNQWSEKLRDARESVRKADETETTNRQELRKAAAEHDALKIGWDRMWQIPARGPNLPQDAPTIANRNGQLILNNLGERQGLSANSFQDPNGANQTARPIIHAFYGGGENTTTYAGEFIVTDVGPTNAVMVPVHPLDPQVVAAWPMNAPWRLRTMVPAAARARIDELFRRARRTRELTTATDANITRQQELKQAADDALAVREAELLGDPAREAVAGRPEFTDGLLKVTELTEEQRDQLLLDIDQLRRAIKAQSEQRDQLVQQLQQAAQSLPGASGQQSSRTSQPHTAERSPSDNPAKS